MSTNVLKIDAEDLPAIEFGDTTNLRKGQFVLTLGNPDAIARDGEPSASWGIISNLSRMAPTVGAGLRGNKSTVHEYGTLIHTDAKLNFDTSGGALLNLDGQLIGLTTSLAPRKSSPNSAGFAIAADALFLRVVDELKAGRLPSFGFLGIQPDDLRLSDREKGRQGARVRLVLPGLPAERAGLRADDIIVEINGKKIFDRDDLFRELSQPAAGAVLEMKIHRYRSLESAPSVRTIRAELGKKPNRSDRPSFARNESPSWRGLKVDYWTAVSSDIQRLGFSAPRYPSLKVAVSDIEHSTPVWNSGIRAGYGILKVEGRAVESPEAFHEAVEASPGPVRLEILQADGSKKQITIPAPEQNPSGSS